MSASTFTSQRGAESAEPLSADEARIHRVDLRIGGVLIERRLNGPRGFANGGFAAGSIAQHIDGDTVTVVLQRPVPLGRTLDVARDTEHGVVVYDRRRVIARARPGVLTDAPMPPAPTYDEALIARARHPLTGLRHPLSDCVVCGPQRNDGMHVTPGPVPGDSDRLAAPWTVEGGFAHAGFAQYPAVWGALDCTSYPARALEDRTLCLLGTMTARVERRPRVGEHLVIHSWTREQHGRRYETSIAMVDADGESVARADATWIALKSGRALAMARWLR